MVSDARIGYYPRPDPEAVSSATRCSTTYGSAAPPWGPSTDYFTSTLYAYRVKTQFLTPKPFTTSVSSTSTYTEWETAPNNLTKTVYTDTYAWTNYLTTTETVYSTSTITTSVLSSTTVPTFDGFTPVQASYPQATQHVDDWADRDNWAVEDEYFQDEGDDPYILPLFADRAGPLALDALAPTAGNNTTSPPNPSGSASKVDCLVTIINIYEAGTSTTKSSAPPPTYTRTAIVSTSTITSTVRTKPNPTETPYTYSQASALEIRSWYTETTTKTETVRRTPSPFATPANKATDHDHRIPLLNDYFLRRLRHKQHRRHLRQIPARPPRRRLVRQEPHHHPPRLERGHECDRVLRRRCAESGCDFLQVRGGVRGFRGRPFCGLVEYERED